MKKCSRCKKIKSVVDFYKDKRTKSGLYSACNKCHYSYFSLSNTEYKRNWNRKWKKENREHCREYFREWKKKNPEYYRMYKKRRMNNPRVRLDKNIAYLIWFALKEKKAGKRWETFVDYTLQDLMEHLEKQFDESMTWDNYGSYWQVDHIKPQSLFNYSLPSDKEFMECWALENLQPLEAKENMRKANRYEK